MHKIQISHYSYNIEKQKKYYYYYILLLFILFIYLFPSLKFKKCEVKKYYTGEKHMIGIQLKMQLSPQLVLDLVWFNTVFHITQQTHLHHCLDSMREEPRCFFAERAEIRRSCPVGVLSHVY